MGTQNEPDMSKSRPRLHILVDAPRDSVNTDELFEKEFRMRWPSASGTALARESQVSASVQKRLCV